MLCEKEQKDSKLELTFGSFIFKIFKVIHVIIYLVEYLSRVWKIDAIEILTCDMPTMSEQIVRQNHAIGTRRKMLVQEFAHNRVTLFI